VPGTKMTCRFVIGRPVGFATRLPGAKATKVRRRIDATRHYSTSCPCTEFRLGSKTPEPGIRYGYSIEVGSVDNQLALR
jgi:hypothetical protein